MTIDTTTGKKVLYKDLDMRFISHPITGNVVVKNNQDSIKQAVRRLVMLNQYEKLGNPDIFTNIPQLLFSLDVPNTLPILIQSRIEDIIQYYEPRATVKKVDVKDYPNENQLGITIYYIPENAIEMVSVEVLIERIR